MAEAPPLILDIPTEQRANGLKLSRLIFDEGKAALRSLFDRYHPSASLVAGLEQNYTTLFSLLEKRLLTQTQWELLFPTDASVPCSQNMDMHLLFLLLHNICGLTEPSSGWNNLPLSSDESLEGNVARLQWYISEVTNRVPSRGVQTVQFDFYWYEITTVLKSFGVYNSTSTCTEDLKTKSLSEVDEKKYLLLLVEWRVRDQEMQDQLRMVEITSEKKKQTLTFVQKAQDKTLKAMQDPTTGKMPFTWSKSSIIGTGGKGTKVYRGKLKSSGKQVAVKRMYSGIFDMKEAEKLRKCHHPNIIRCFNTHKEEEFFYIALELCEKTLKECIDDEEFTSADVSRRECLTQVSSGVVYLHDNKICHRDIKPDNILLTMKNDENTRRRFVLADFNCARDVPSGETFSTQHSTAGTTGWMAPEANEVGRRRTLKIDVFSLGCVFYYILTNKKHPFGDINNGDECQACINMKMIDPLLEGDNFVEHACLCDLISRMVNSNQNWRPNSSEVHSRLVLKLADEDLYRKVSSILDNLTPQTFQRQASQILELEIDSPERLKGVADRIFEKAICESSFSVACANMCGCLMPDQIKGKGDSIARRSLVEALFNKCQEEIEEKTFSRRNAKEPWLAHVWQAPDGRQGRKLKLKKPSGDDVRRRSLGNIRFIGELFKLKIFTENNMHDCIAQLLRSTDKESSVCLYNLLTTIGKDLDHAEAQPCMDKFFNHITKIIQNRGTSWGVCFMLMDVVELRRRRWTAVTKDNNSERDSSSKVDPQAEDGKDSVARGESKIRFDSPKYQNIDTKLKRSANPWVGPKYQVRKCSEQAKTFELYRKVISILNKLTPQKFQTLTKQILELEIDTPERLEGVVDRIFEKAISEPKFSTAYANMCKCLMTIKVQIEGKDGKEAHVNFRKILLNKCQKEFEKEKSEKNLVHAKMDALAQQGLKEHELELRKAELEIEETEMSMRRRSLGNIRFIGELFKLKMLTENIMHKCVLKLLRSTDEKSYECLCKLLTTIGKDLDYEKAKPRVDQHFDQINKIIETEKTSRRVRFKLMDIVELRKNNWIPKGEDSNPKTIDQIHREAQEQKKRTKGKDNTIVSSNLWRQPYPQLYRRKQGVSVNQKGTRTERTPRAEECLQWRLEEHEMREKIKALIRELHSTGSITKAVKGFEDMKTSGKEHVLVSTAMEILVDYTQRSSDRQATGQLFSALLKSGAVFMTVFALSVCNVLEILEDIELDVPYMWGYFAEAIGIPVAEGYLPMMTLSDCANMMRQKTSACKMLEEVLVKAVGCLRDESFSSLWSRLQWNTFFASEAEAKEFLKRKQLKLSENFWERPRDNEHLPAEQAKTDVKDVVQSETKRDEKPQQHRPGTKEQLRELIVLRRARNQEVIEWIEKNVDKTNTTQFIRNLMTYVCEASIQLTRGRYGSRIRFKCDEDLLRSRTSLLRKYIGGDSQLELQALYALQSLFVALDHPTDFLQPFFFKLYFGKVVAGDSFISWKFDEDSAEDKGRRLARKSTTGFFEMLQEVHLDRLIQEEDAYIMLNQNEAQIGEQFQFPQDDLEFVYRPWTAFSEQLNYYNMP